MLLRWRFPSGGLHAIGAAMAKAIGVEAEAAKKRLGRPRLLTTEQVLDAAIGLGLDGLTMGAVAERLGVSIGMLYGYVSSREELIQLAAARVVQDYDYPEDIDQSWPVYAAENAVAWYKFFTGPGEFLVRYIAGRTGPAAEIDRTREWLAAMAKRGIESHRALLLHRQMGEIVMGGAVTEIHLRAVEAMGKPLAAALVARRDREEEDEIQSHMLAAQQAVWHLSLLNLFSALASERREDIDVGPVMRILEDVLGNRRFDARAPNGAHYHEGRTGFPLRT